MAKIRKNHKALMRNYLSLFILILMWLIRSNDVIAQEVTQQALPAIDEINWGSYAKWASVLLGILIFVILFQAMVYGNKPEVKKEKKKFSFIRLVSKISAAAPLEEEQGIMMEDNFDGIRELNNKIPPWFNILFYGSIIFAAIYLLNFHVFGNGDISHEEYAAEMQKADFQKEILRRSGKLVSEETVTALKDPGSIQSGKETFLSKCAVCHGRAAEGLIGPNLTDDYWIHGAGIKNVFRVVKNGVQQKGMPNWDSQLSPKQIQEVASYVLSLHGTNPSNALPPLIP